MLTGRLADRASARRIPARQAAEQLLSSLVSGQDFDRAWLPPYLEPSAG